MGDISHVLNGNKERENVTKTVTKTSIVNIRIQLEDL